MPNWCSCDLEITGKKEDITKLLENAKKEDSLFSIEKLFPMPNTETDWYNWRTTNWGTKWDLSDVQLDNQGEFVQLTFETAWGPPLEAFDKISKDYPSLNFAMTFREPGMDFFGKAEFKNGKNSEETCTYSEQFSATVKFNYEKITVDNDIISIPVILSFKEDPYEFDSDITTRNGTITLPLDIESTDVYERYGDSVKFENEMNEKNAISLNEDELAQNIISAIEENLDLIKKAAQHNTLNQALQVNTPKKKPKYTL